MLNWRKILFYIFWIVPLLHTGWYIHYCGLDSFLRINGAGIGFMAGIVYLSWLLAKGALPKRFLLLSYFALVLVWINYFGYLDFAGRAPIFSAVAGKLVTLGFFLFFLGYFFFLFFILFVAEPLIKGIKAFDKECKRVCNRFGIMVLGGSAPIPLGCIIFVLFITPTEVLHRGETIAYFQKHFFQSLWFLGGQIITWLLILVLNRKTDYSIIEKWIVKRDIGRYPLKRELLTGFLLVLSVGTFFEMFRGLWSFWTLFVIWLTLMVIAIRKIWKPVFKPV